MDTTTKDKIENLIKEMVKLVASGDGDKGQRPLMAGIQVLIAEEQAKSAEKVERQTDELVIQTQRLVSETVILRRFTKGVFWLTIVLAILTVVLIVIAYLEYAAKANECLIR